MRNVASVVAAVVVASLMLGACGCNRRLRAGDECALARAPAFVACASDREALLCKNGKLLAVPCRGSTGCKGSGGCDMNLGEAGEACVASEHETRTETACATDKQKTLICESTNPALF